MILQNYATGQGNFKELLCTATKSLGPSGVVQAFLENEKDILNNDGPDNKFPGAIWEFQKCWFQHDNYLGIIYHRMNYFICMTEEANI